MFTPDCDSLYLWDVHDSAPDVADGAVERHLEHRLLRHSEIEMNMCGSDLDIHSVCLSVCLSESDLDICSVCLSVLTP